MWTSQGSHAVKGHWRGVENKGKLSLNSACPCSSAPVTWRSVKHRVTACHRDLGKGSEAIIFFRKVRSQTLRR